MLLLVGFLSMGGVAHADVVNQFNFQLKDIKTDGRYTVVFSSRSYDTSGAVPPQLTRSYIRIPKGATFRKQLLAKSRGKYLCDYQKLHDIKNASACPNSEIGKGTAKADPRLIINPLTGQPYVNDLLPYNVHLYLAKPQAPGAIVSFLILAEPDLGSGLFPAAGILRDTTVVLAANFFSDPTPDGKYGYRLEVPVGPPVVGLKISVAAVDVTTPGQTLKTKKKKCVKKSKGKCVKRTVKKSNLFWFGEPTCPPSKQLPFLSYYQYEGIPTPQTVEMTVPCPAFKH